MPAQESLLENSDRLAMQRLVAGDDRALSELMERWKKRMTSYLFRLTGSESMASDLAQETFVRLYQTRFKFRSQESERSFSGWLFGIAANLGKQHLRWQRRHPTLPLEMAHEATTSGDPSLSVESKERVVAVKEAIASLTDDLREALILSEYEQLSQAEIAVIAGCSVKAVERRLSHARERLYAKLHNYLSETR
jgi:RNA polymerase sigma-70 factor (ECF subfamily)